ncbi:hypothetical protein EH183_40790 [Streptomyces sp. CB01881]|uniref:hypothetical protein n=1 Tax=Streptomyces sp. CB01881 TaxID=2078691 RepID=UPI0011DF8C2F|nr:hypothetical protein [Streptomyces sp. CB01881]TYC68178.1 hypothetical protein EH183_40790 [Streptomyces sp. CB01881]
MHGRGGHREWLDRLGAPVEEIPRLAATGACCATVSNWIYRAFVRRHPLRRLDVTGIGRLLEEFDLPAEALRWRWTPGGPVRRTSTGLDGGQ